jgi:hypothetical protein
MTTYTYQTIDPPGSTYTVAESINASEEIVGYYQDSHHLQHGFLDNNASTQRLILPAATVELSWLTSIRLDKSSGPGARRISLQQGHLHDN